MDAREKCRWLLHDGPVPPPSPAPTPPPYPQSSAVQGAFDAMPRRLYACTPTRLTAWLDCPRRYRFGYLDRPPPPKGPPWAHNSLGAAVHTALAAWWRLPAPERTPTRAGDLLEAGWRDDGFRDDAQAAGWRNRARKLVERYVAGLDPHDEPLGVERTVAARTPVLAVSGRIDRLDRRRGPDGTFLVVVDYKTGRRPLTADDARTSLPLALYAALAARVLRMRCARVELHHLPTGRVLAHEHTPESLQRQVKRAEATGEEAAAADAAYAAYAASAAHAASAAIGASSAGTAGRARIATSAPAQLGLDEVFPPRPGRQCGWCDYSRHCPEGRAASPARASWDGLGDLPDPGDPPRPGGPAEVARPGAPCPPTATPEAAASLSVSGAVSGSSTPGWCSTD